MRGKEIYKEAMPIAQKLYITEIDHEYKGDVYLPDWKPFLKNEISKKIVKTDSVRLTFRILSK